LLWQLCHCMALFSFFNLVFMQFSWRCHQELIAVLKTGDYFGEARRPDRFHPVVNERHERWFCLKIIKLIIIPYYPMNMSIFGVNSQVSVPYGNIWLFPVRTSIYYVGLLEDKHTPYII
jgi:hypothetical protein